MTKRRRSGSPMLPNGRSAGGEPFVRLSHRLLDSPAFAATSGDAIKLLLVIWRRHNGFNNSGIAFGVGDSQKAIGCGRRRAAEVLAELQAFGLIECAEPAARLGRRSRRWALSEEDVAVANGTTRPATYAARRLSQAEVGEISGRLRAARLKAKGDPAARFSGVSKNKRRTPVGTDIVPPSEPQNVPLRDQPALRTPVDTDGGRLRRPLRTPVGTSLNIARGSAPRMRPPLVLVPRSDSSPPAAAPARKRSGRAPRPVQDGPAPEIDALLARGWTFRTLARRFGVHEQTIKGWRTGRLRLPEKRRAELAALMSGDAA